MALTPAPLSVPPVPAAPAYGTPPEAAPASGVARRVWQVALAGLALGIGAILFTGSRESEAPVSNYASLAQPRTASVASGVPAADNLVLPAGAPSDAPIGPAADIARVINASIPMMAQGSVPATPLLVNSSTGGTLNRERAIDCLAAAGYYEAGTRPADQRAVMQVVLNRVRHSAFPHSVCGVVFQGSERQTGCQFTFTCDGALQRRQPSAAAWQQARMVAVGMLSGRTEPLVGHATHYHTNWVHPVWSGEMQKIAAVDTHLFFRWRGRAGEPTAFKPQYSGTEPQVQRMSLLSPAHYGNPIPGLETPTAGAVQLALPEPSGPSKNTYAMIGVREPLPDLASAPDADVILVALDAGADPDSFLRQAEQSCAGKATCRFLGWTNPARKASQIPISGAANDAMSFSYIRHAAGDPGKARWNCAEFPRGNTAQCLRRGG